MFNLKTDGFRLFGKGRTQEQFDKDMESFRLRLEEAEIEQERRSDTEDNVSTIDDSDVGSVYSYRN